MVVEYSVIYISFEDYAWNGLYPLYIYQTAWKIAIATRIHPLCLFCSEPLLGSK
jgi:hypothetical protein